MKLSAYERGKLKPNRDDARDRRKRPANFGRGTKVAKDWGIDYQLLRAYRRNNFPDGDWEEAARAYVKMKSQTSLSKIAREQNLPASTLQYFKAKYAPNESAETTVVMYWQWKRKCSMKQKAADVGLHPNAISRFRYRAKNGPRQNWTDEEIIEHLLEKRKYR